MPSRTSRRRARGALARLIVAAAALAAAASGTLLLGSGAGGHGFSTVVYVDASDSGGDTVRARLELEYDLLVVSVADLEGAPQFFEDGMDVFQTGDEATALNAHADDIADYVSERFGVTADGEDCAP